MRASPTLSDPELISSSRCRASPAAAPPCSGLLLRASSRARCERRLITAAGVNRSLVREFDGDVEGGVEALRREVQDGAAVEA